MMTTSRNWWQLSMRQWRRGTLAGILAVTLASVATPAVAEPISSPRTPAASTQTTMEATSTQDLKALLATLQDPVLRGKLISQIQALIALRQTPGQTQTQATPAPSPPSDAAQSPGVQAIAATSDQIRKVSDALVSGASTLLDFPALIDWSNRQVGDEAARSAWLVTALKLAIILAVAVLAEQTAVFLLRRPRRSAADRELSARWARLTLLAVRLLMELFQIAIFGAAAYIALFLIAPGNLVRVVALAFVNANVIIRAVLAIGRSVLAPPGSTWQPLGIRPETGGYWFVWLRRLVSLAVYGYALADAALIIGLPVAAYDVLNKALGLALAALVTVLILQNRPAVARWIRGDSKDNSATAMRALRARLADIWHVLALLYVAAIFGVWVAQVSGGFEFIARASAISIVVLIAVKALVSAGDGLLERFFSIGKDLQRRFPGLEARADRYLPILVVALHVALYACAALIISEAWGLGSFHWLRSDMGRQIVAALATVVVTVAVATLIWEGTSLLMEYYFFRQTADEKRHLRRGRARTLLPLLRRTTAIVLIVFVFLIGLSELGVNIAPLLAGAGVIGIAVGLGAQSLVKDLINGLNLLLEDTIAVGDTITVGTNSGEVEAISMRTIRLRDGKGAVHTIPFSEITRVINSSREFGCAVFDIPIGFTENYDKMVDVLQAIAAELQSDPAIAPLILEPPMPPVLDRFTDYAMIVHLEIKTLPGKQTEIARQFNRRLKRRLDELGIEMPYPSRRLYMADKTKPEEDEDTHRARPVRRA
jgi:moderate conductance mechanosensitive channel